MSTAELKINLIQRITQLDDSFLIEEMQRLIDFDSEKKEFAVTPEQDIRITEARKEYKSGNTFSEEEANREIEEWLKR